MSDPPPFLAGKRSGGLVRSNFYYIPRPLVNRLTFLRETGEGGKVGWPENVVSNLFSVREGASDLHRMDLESFTGVAKYGDDIIPSMKHYDFKIAFARLIPPMVISLAVTAIAMGQQKVSTVELVESSMLDEISELLYFLAGLWEEISKYFMAIVTNGFGVAAGAYGVLELLYFLVAGKEIPKIPRKVRATIVLFFLLGAQFMAWKGEYRARWQEQAAKIKFQKESKRLEGAIRDKELVERFKSERVFHWQFRWARRIVALHDTRVLPGLEAWLSHEDRHIRGNAAFIFAALGDDRGFEVLKAILTDRGDRAEGQGIATARWSLQAQINADRYYAIHLFGELRDRRAAPILIPLLQDGEVMGPVAWALGEIGDRSAIDPLIEKLSHENPGMRVIVIDALEKLDAVEALPKLRLLLNDNERSTFGDGIPVADAARKAIAKLEARR